MRNYRTRFKMVLALGNTPVLAEDTYPIPAIKIPNTSILPNQKVLPVPAFIGQPAVANPITTRDIPQNPYTAPDPWCTIHNDSYMSDTYPGPGPLGKSPEVFSTALGTKAGSYSDRRCHDIRFTRHREPPDCRLHQKG